MPVQLAISVELRPESMIKRDLFGDTLQQDLSLLAGWTSQTRRNCESRILTRLRTDRAEAQPDLCVKVGGVLECLDCFVCPEVHIGFAFPLKLLSGNSTKPNRSFEPGEL